MNTLCDCCGKLTYLDIHPRRPRPDVVECELCAEDNARVAAENAAYDAAEEAKKDAQWKVITDAMACYPTRIPEEWTR